MLCVADFMLDVVEFKLYFAKCVHCFTGPSCAGLLSWTVLLVLYLTAQP